MNTVEVQNIKRLLNNSFGGAAWHGPSVLKVLEDIDHAIAFKVFDNIHSIAELVEHMVSWRRFTLERLKGNNTYDIVESEDWKTFSVKDENTWLEIKSRLMLSQNDLISELDKIKDSKLTDLVDGKAYDYYTLLHGVIQHDIYHTGQISLLKKR